LTSAAAKALAAVATIFPGIAGGHGRFRTDGLQKAFDARFQKLLDKRGGDGAGRGGDDFSGNRRP